ncbi:MAG: DoxX family protein [Bacteroidetes bacterium RBG_13_42_15]|nr:MAG: DoxX family protein [Bacteroidetes bacterium RBG_13_42_15]
MKKLQSIIFRTVNDYRSVIPRLIVGLVFLSEGIQKFIFPELVGTGRFEKIGFANPEFLASFVAWFEIVSSVLILIGLSVRIAAIPLLIIMITAITTTKIPILLEKGFWAMAHEARTDFAMTMLIVFLLIYGSSKLSIDSVLQQRLKSR